MTSAYPGSGLVTGVEVVAPVPLRDCWATDCAGGLDMACLYEDHECQRALKLAVGVEACSNQLAFWVRWETTFRQLPWELIQKANR